MERAQDTVMEVESATERGLAYMLLARSLAYPDEEHVEALREVAQNARPFLAESVLRELVASAEKARREDLEQAFVRVFSLGTSPDCPGFETAFFPAEAVQQTTRMADVAGFYRAFGVDVGGPGLRPDDITVELEFMAFLCRKQVYASEHLGARRVAEAVRIQQLFLKEHLGQWGRAFGIRVAQRAGDPFYRVTGEALSAWIAADCARMKATPLVEADTPPADWAIAHAEDVAADEESQGEMAEGSLM